MVAKRYIQNNLIQIENLYTKSTSTQHAMFYSKLAVLELCGWIEESMDEILRSLARRHLKDPSNLQLVENSIIRRTYGFEYNKHFRSMLMQVLGIISLERLEHKLDPVKFQLMESTLETLKACRDIQAHTHLRGSTRRLDAPSVTKSRFIVVYEGLKDVQDNLKRLKL